MPSYFHRSVGFLLLVLITNFVNDFFSYIFVPIFCMPVMVLYLVKNP